ncbi:hypothetical protein JZ751_023929, partial [Albula glossodonta]
MAAPWCWEIESINETFKRLFERRSPVLQEELGLGRTWRSATRKFVAEGGSVEWEAEFTFSAHPSDSGMRAGKQSPSLKDGRAPLTPLLSSLGPVFLQALIAF